MRKHVLRTLGVSLLAALGLMAFAATGAQAEKAGEIRVLGSAHLANGVPVTGKQLGLGTLKVPNLNIEIVCNDLEVLAGKILEGLTGHGEGEILYLGCVAWSIKSGTLELSEILKECQILDSVSGKIGHIRAKAFLLVLLHKGDTYILAEPNPLGSIFAKVKFTSGIGCPLTLIQEIKGSTVFKVTAGDLALGAAEVLEIEIENNETIAALFPSDELKYGINKAFIIGKADLHLAGETHKNCTWGVV